MLKTQNGELDLIAINIVLTPKVGFPISDKISLGAGLLIGGAGGSGVGALGYGVATYGSSDSNFTLGLGYGFGSSSPILVLAGMHRVSKSISLVSENYIGRGSFDDSGIASSVFGI